jgi:hypothetical protein
MLAALDLHLARLVPQDHIQQRGRRHAHYVLLVPT